MIHARTAHTPRSTKEQEYLLGWQRSRAELVNFRKSLQSFEPKARALLQRQVLESLLTVADNFKAVAAHLPPSLASDQWAQGVVHVARQLEQVLVSLGLEVIEAKGQPFDPAIHEAVAEVEGAPVASQHVAEVVQTGYRVGETVLRPAKVKLAA